MSGTDILAEIKSDERLQRTPVVVLTTTDDKVEIQRCYDLGCNVYITKPVTTKASPTPSGSSACSSRSSRSPRPT